MQNKPITPEQYLIIKEVDIKAVPIGAEKYDFMVNLVHELRKCRNSKATTQNVLDPFFKTPFDNKEEVEEWLMAALWNDDSFVYAYNCMVEDQNFSGYRYEEKFVSERLLHTLLLKKQPETQNHNSSSEKEIPQRKYASEIPENIDPIKKQRLIKIFKKASDAKVIDCTDELFLYWFGGKFGQCEQKKIRWKKKNNRKKFHKSALFWFCKEINPEMKPKEMTEIFGTKIEPKNNNYTAEIDMTEIFK